jgi:hypothetical protein
VPELCALAAEPGGPVNTREREAQHDRSPLFKGLAADREDCHRDAGDEQ